jgi:hypothetical protein
MMTTKQPLQLVTFNHEQWYRGIMSNGQVLFTMADVVDMNRELPERDLFDPDEWLSSVDGESCFLAAHCSSCGKEFRPIDGFVPGNGFVWNGQSYCPQC